MLNLPATSFNTFNCQFDFFIFVVMRHFTHTLADIPQLPNLMCYT